LVAHAFSWPAAWQASGRDWPGLVLPRLLQDERYPAVRYLGHRALRKLYGDGLECYEYQAQPAVRAVQLERLRAQLGGGCRPLPDAYPGLPLTPEGQLDEALLRRLLQHRNDPDVLINE
jgi:hypothetical protein